MVWILYFADVFKKKKRPAYIVSVCLRNDMPYSHIVDAFCKCRLTEHGHFSSLKIKTIGCAAGAKNKNNKGPKKDVIALLLRTSFGGF